MIWNPRAPHKDTSGEREHEDIFRQYFASVCRASDNKFAAPQLRGLSGGSFVYVPKGVKVYIPLQANFRINTMSLSQFERTLAVVDDGASFNT
jgi:Fe-S cluster assembly protein SufB